jgi:molybdopterin-guanine dinucleotide biosynthesis protein A
VEQTNAVAARSATAMSPAAIPCIGPVLRGMTAPDVDLALPVARGFRQPLAAGYRTSLARLITDLIAEGDLRPGMLFQHCQVPRLEDSQLLAGAALARYDPELESVVNINTPEDYAEAHARPPAEITVQRFGALAGDGRRGRPAGRRGQRGVQLRRRRIH